MESNAVYLCKLVNIPFVLILSQSINIPKLDLSRFNAAYFVCKLVLLSTFSIFERR